MMQHAAFPSRCSGSPSRVPQHAAFPSGCSDFPSWVLLDTVAHIGRCDNETTAHGTTSAGCPIEVSFVVVDPPGLSRCIIYCPDLGTGNSRASPCVTGADGAFLLIRVSFPERDGIGMLTDMFVYRASAGTPSLYRLPQPYPIRLHSSYVGVLSCGDVSEHCLVVVPERRIAANRRVRYDLHVFSTKAKSWSTKDPRVSCGADLCYSEFEPTKVFSVAGDSLAWVDLQFGILLCKGLDGDPEMLLIQLPTLRAANQEKYGVDSDGCSPPMDRIRDVTFTNGWFRFIEIEFLELDTDISQPQWRATVFKRNVCSENWELCCTMDSNLEPADSCFPYLFPEIYDYKENKLTLNRVISSLPTLDQYNDNIVYMISKLRAIDTNGWILAVNTTDKKLEKVVPFSAERLYFHRAYLQCAFSKYLRKAPGTRLAETLEKCTNREKIEVLETYLMASLEELRNIEIHMESMKRSYNGSMPLLSTGPSSSLDLGTDAESCSTNGRSKHTTHTVDEVLRVMGVFELQISAPIDLIKSKVRVAHGALYSLMRSLPSDVLDE